MLTISNHYFELLDRIYERDETIDTREELGKILQSALELEFSTIPPYLSAAYSLNKYSNRSIRDLIVRIAKEEMLHMTVVANLMNAIGIPPQLTNPEFIPEYPYTPSMLDMPGFQLHVESFSRDLEKSKQYVRDFFMKIEEPEDPQEYPIERAAPEDILEVAAKPKTIGLFYESIIKIIRDDRIPGLFDGAKANEWRQVVVQPKTTDPGIVYPNFKPLNVEGTTKDYPLQPGYDLKIIDKQTAIKFLRWVVDEGEGTTKDPIDEENLAAHYYRFESIVNGKYLIVDQDYEEGYAYAGTELIFNTSESGIWEFDKTDPKESDYSGDLYDAVHEFDVAYSEMLRYLNAAFNANTPEEIRPAYMQSRSEMLKLPNLVDKVKGVARSQGLKGGLPFQYIESEQPA